MTADSLIEAITTYCEHVCDPHKPKDSWEIGIPKLFSIIRQHEADTMGDAPAREEGKPGDLGVRTSPATDTLIQLLSQLADDKPVDAAYAKDDFFSGAELIARRQLAQRAFEIAKQSEIRDAKCKYPTDCDYPDCGTRVNGGIKCNGEYTAPIYDEEKIKTSIFNTITRAEVGLIPSHRTHLVHIIYHEIKPYLKRESGKRVCPQCGDVAVSEDKVLGISGCKAGHQFLTEIEVRAG